MTSSKIGIPITESYLDSFQCLCTNLNYLYGIYNYDIKFDTLSVKRGIVIVLDLTNKHLEQIHFYFYIKEGGSVDQTIYVNVEINVEHNIRDDSTINYTQFVLLDQTIRFKMVVKMFYTRIRLTSDIKIQTVIKNDLIVETFYTNSIIVLVTIYLKVSISLDIEINNNHESINHNLSQIFTNQSPLVNTYIKDIYNKVILEVNLDIEPKYRIHSYLIILFNQFPDRFLYPYRPYFILLYRCEAIVIKIQIIEIINFKVRLFFSVRDP